MPSPGFIPRGLPEAKPARLSSPTLVIHTRWTVRHFVCVLLLVLSQTAEAKPKPKAKAKPAAAAAKVRTVDAATAKHLGAAYHAYDDNDLAAAQKHLAKIDDAKA